MKNYKIQKRIVCRVGKSFVENVEMYCGSTWIGRTKYTHAALRGIPRRLVSILIPETELVVGEKYLIEIGIKIGKYSGNTRKQITIRDLNRTPVDSIPGIIYNDSTLICWAVGDTGVVAIQSQFDQTELKIFKGKLLRTECITTQEGVRKIIAWHWTRYYTHLKHDEVQDVLLSFVPIQDETLTACNRRASRVLYQRSKELGWKKMTKREREKYQLDGSQWQKISTVESRLMSATGCGEFTLKSARIEYRMCRRPRSC